MTKVVNGKQQVVRDAAAGLGRSRAPIHGKGATLADPSSFGIAGLLGWPGPHSRSPVIHNHWLAHYGIRGTLRAVPGAAREARGGRARAGRARHARLQRHHAAQAGDLSAARPRRRPRAPHRRRQHRRRREGRHADRLQQRRQRLRAEPARRGPAVAARCGTDRSCSAPAAPRAPWWPTSPRRVRAKSGWSIARSTRRRPSPHEFGPPVTARALGPARRRARRRGAARERDEPRHGRQAAARHLPRAPAAARAGRRPHLHSAGNAAAGRGARARQRHGERPGTAAQPGASRVQRVVRRDAGDHAGAAPGDRRPRSRFATAGRVMQHLRRAEDRLPRPRAGPVAIPVCAGHALPAAGTGNRHARSSCCR